MTQFTNREPVLIPGNEIPLDVEGFYMQSCTSYIQVSPPGRDQGAVEQCVKYLCEQGCMKVSEYIEAMLDNQDLPELARLSKEERAAVLDELLSIMSVYEGKCSC